MPIQNYVSNELTHFVGRHLNDGERFDLLIKIINDGWILHPPFIPSISGTIGINIKASKLEDIVTPEITCFADIPIQDLHLHMGKYSNFGLSFNKQFLVEKGANPVLYVVQNANDKILKDRSERDPFEWSPNYSSYKTISRDELYKENVKKYFNFWIDIRDFLRAEELRQGQREEISKNLANLKEVNKFLIRHVFAFMKPFDASKSDDDLHNYYMEREWRLVGNLQFDISDINRLLIPKSYAKELRERLPGYSGEITYTDKEHFV